MDPIVDGIQKKYKGQVAFKRVDIDEPASRDLIEQFHIRGIPNFVFVDGAGEKVSQQVGLRPAEALESAVEELLEVDAQRRRGITP